MAHNLALLQSSPYLSGCFRCNLCWEKGCGPVYHCSDCEFDIHTSCAAIAAQQTHFCHPYHPLLLSPDRGSHKRSCDSCGFKIRAWSFRCDTCGFDIHSMCARAPQTILHPRHSDPLVLSNSESVPGPNTCNACRMPVSHFFYHCRSCGYNLDQVCATLPTKIKHVRHQAHTLHRTDHSTRQGHPPKCDKCRQDVKGWAFHCDRCSFHLHPRCADLVHELPHMEAGAGPGCERSSTHEATLHCSSALKASSNVLQALTPSRSDWEVVERVLQFVQAKAKAEETLPPRPVAEENDECPTCLEGFNSANPKKTTSCGHHFHLPCILDWLEQSGNCPICRELFTLKM